MLYSFVVNAQVETDSKASINTDRPGLGESSQVLPHKRFQLEIGGNYEFDKISQNIGTTQYQNVLFNTTVHRRLHVYNGNRRS